MQQEEKNTAADSDLVVDVSSNELAVNRGKGKSKDDNDVGNVNNLKSV